MSDKIRTYNEYCNLEYYLSPRHRMLDESEGTTSMEAYEDLVEWKDRAILKSTTDNEENAHYCED